MRCYRCGKETGVSIMSMFNTDEICIECMEQEKLRPDYNKARLADEAAIRTGNFNYKGIGWE